MVYVWAVLMVVVNSVWLGLVAVGVPGTWMMLITAGVLAWFYRGMFSVETLIAVGVLCLLGEIGESLGGLAGATKGGAGWRGALGAVIGGLIGGVFGTAILPVPVAGTVIMSCVGAGVGAIALELGRAENMGQLREIGWGAGIGRLVGTLSKVVVGVAIWVILAVAAFWP